MPTAGSMTTTGITSGGTRSDPGLPSVVAHKNAGSLGARVEDAVVRINGQRVDLKGREAAARQRPRFASIAADIDAAVTEARIHRAGIGGVERDRRTVLYVERRPPRCPAVGALLQTVEAGPEDRLVIRRVDRHDA